jgi:hypothetical protein
MIERESRAVLPEGLAEIPPTTGIRLCSTYFPGSR